MAIFISYSHEDSDFVDNLAANLVKAKHHIWVDRWELNIGDSLTSKIEENLTASDAIIIVLSAASIASNWCRRELNAGLVRELEEKRVIVLPVIIDDCKLPLFLRDKLYADFRKDPDVAFDLIDRSLAKISNPTMNRFETPEFHTDFAIDWQSSDNPQTEETWVIRLTFVDHSEKFPYVLVSELKAYEVSGENKFEEEMESGRALQFAQRLMKAVVEKEEKAPLTGLLSDNTPQYVAWTTDISGGVKFRVIYSYRRLGVDNGMDTVVYLGNNLKMAYRHIDNLLKGQA